MFNPNNDFDVTKLWDAIGSFYNRLNNEEKEKINNYWRALFNSTESLFYDLAQYYLSNSPIYYQGYIERSFNTYIINPDKLEKTYLQPPAILNNSTNGSSSFTVWCTSVNNVGESNISNPVTIYYNSLPVTISWTSVSGITGYNVYKQVGNNIYSQHVNTNSLIDDGNNWAISTDLPTINTAIDKYIFQIPDGDYYISLTTLSGIYYNNILYEDIDYNIVNGKYLYIKSDKLVKDKYITGRGICISPIIFNFYLTNYIPQPRKILSNLYPSYIKTNNKLEEKIFKAIHLFKWCHALATKLLEGPTIKILKEVIGLYYNVPFSYEDGIVTNIENVNNKYNITISGSKEYTYIIPNNLILDIQINDNINRYDLLSNSITIDDYITNSGLINSFVNISGGINEYQFFNTVVCNIPEEYKQLNHNDDYVNFCFDNIFPPNLNIIKI